MQSVYDARDGGAALVRCAVCDRPIAGGNWFRRLSEGDRTVALCSAACTNTFEADPQLYIRRIQTLEHIRPD
jgi:hypothetical protein